MSDQKPKDSGNIASVLGNKSIVAGALLVFGTLGAGSIVGLTIEPEETTQLRVENATLKERTSNLEAEVVALRSRVEMLETIVQSCQELAESCKPGG